MATSKKKRYYNKQKTHHAHPQQTHKKHQGVLRTSNTVEMFKRVPSQPPATSPLLVYFGVLLTKSKLNAFESVELSKLVLSQNKKHLLDNWLKVGGGGFISFNSRGSRIHWEGFAGRATTVTRPDKSTGRSTGWKWVFGADQSSLRHGSEASTALSPQGWQTGAPFASRCVAHSRSTHLLRGLRVGSSLPPFTPPIQPTFLMHNSHTHTTLLCVPSLCLHFSPLHRRRS